MKFGLTGTVSDLFAITKGLFVSADLSIFHEFAPPSNRGRTSVFTRVLETGSVKRFAGRE